MIENTVADLIESIKDDTGQVNLSNPKAVRLLNRAADDYSRLRIFGSGRWNRDSANHGDISRVTATVSTAKVDLETELIALEHVSILVDGKYQTLQPKDQREEDTPLETLYNTPGRPQYYDYDNHHLYLYPAPDGAYTVKLEYKRAHPRFSANNLTQSTGVVPIDDEFLILGASVRLMIGKNDPSVVQMRDMYEQMKREIKDSLSKMDMDTPRRLKGKVPSAFMRSSRGYKQ